MQHNESFLQHLTRCLAAAQFPDGRSLYNLNYQTKFSADDESSIMTLAYAANPNLYESDEELYISLDTKFTECLQAFTHENLKRIPTPNTLDDKWTSAAGDFIQCNYSDHTLYIILYESGQY